MLSRDLLERSFASWVAVDFRREGPWWLQWVWTALACLLVAVGFTVLGFTLYGGGRGAWRNLDGWWHWYQINAWISLWVGFTVHGLFELVGWIAGVQRVRRWRGLKRTLYVAGVPTVGLLVAWPLSLWVLGDARARWFQPESSNVWFGMLLTALLVNLVVQQLFTFKARQLEAERRETESRLRLLLGQIEPHFLFNTLANVLSLLEREPARAREMLESFVTYLRSSVGSLDRPQHTLGQELELVRAYLRIVQLRMDDRLRYRIDVPDSLHARALPPLTLQPLVENAIVHGLEPKVEGGSLRIGAQASADGRQLQLSVEDDGLGLQPATPRRSLGTGTALQNIRERLLALHGDAARLQIEANTPRGVRALLQLPLTDPPRAEA